MDRYRIIEVKQSVFADNDAAAERLRLFAPSCARKALISSI